MHTQVLSIFHQTHEGRTAEAILRRCSHCGLCNTSCPTYQLSGDENDSPRGRIYLIKQFLEGQLEDVADSGRPTLQHLDNCLQCHHCETSCPANVEYSKLLDIGRRLIEAHAGRERRQQQRRDKLHKTILQGNKSTWSIGRRRVTDKQSNPSRPVGEWPKSQHSRRLLVLEGCSQSHSPEINAATARVLDQLGISLVTAPDTGCCGAISQQLTLQDEAQAAMRRNIDAWWPYISNGVEAVITTNSHCGIAVRDYKYYLHDDPDYAIKAERVSQLCRDIAEIIEQEDYQRLAPNKAKRIAWHSPCSLQHGQKVTGIVENILMDCGYLLTTVNQASQCCGARNEYSLAATASNTAQLLRQQKLDALQVEHPEYIVTADISCQSHLQQATATPVMHWIHLLDTA